MSASAALSAMYRLASPGATAPTTDADMIATDELAVTLMWRDVPNTAYAVDAANAVTRPVSGGIPARPAYAIATGTITPHATRPAMASNRS